MLVKTTTIHYVHLVEAAESVHRTWAQKCHKARLRDMVRMQTVEELNTNYVQLVCMSCFVVILFSWLEWLYNFCWCTTQAHGCFVWFRRFGAGRT